MILLTLSFYTTLIDEFGESVQIEHPYSVNFFELFQLFSSKSGVIASKFFLEPNFDLKNDFNILLNGVNIFGLAGLKTEIKKNAEIDFFPKIGGG